MNTLAGLTGHHPNDIAVEDATQQRTYAELESRTNRLARLLLEHAEPGAHVVLSAGNRVEFVETVLACWRGGLVYTPVKTGWTASELDIVLADAKTRIVVTDRAAAREAAAERGITVVDLDALALAPYPDDEVDAERCGWKLPYTSGTTGRPKGVVPSSAGTMPFSNAFRGSAAMAGVVRLPGEGVHLLVSRLFHGAPFTFALAAFAAGARLRIREKWDAAAALAALAQPDVTSTAMVPTMFRQLLALPGVDRATSPAPHLRTLLHGGEPCPAPTKQAMLDWFGPVLVEYYGFTEGGMTVATSHEWRARPGTVGRAMPGLRIRILGGDNRPVAVGETGTVAFVADSGRRFAYLGDDARTESAHVGQAFTVGDLGHVDADGYLYLTGRSADVIVSAGVNVYPAEVEAALADLPGIRDLCVAGAPDEERGEVPVLFLALEPGADEAAVRAAVAERATERLAPYKRPARVELTDDIPRDDTGKLLRARLRR